MLTTFCFTKQDLPSNAIFPGNPIAPPSNFGSGGGEASTENDEELLQAAQDGYDEYADEAAAYASRYEDAYDNFEDFYHSAELCGH